MYMYLHIHIHINLCVCDVCFWVAHPEKTEVDELFLVWGGNMEGVNNNLRFGQRHGLISKPDLCSVHYSPIVIKMIYLYKAKV